MPERLPYLASLAARSQKLLIEFLEADLDLAFTFLQTAAIEAGTDAEHSERARDKARIALESIRKFQGRIIDPVEWRRIQGRASQLQADLKAFERSK